MPEAIESLKIQGARILFRNFRGVPTKFNPQGGNREFSVVLDPETAENLKNIGWNIKYLPPYGDSTETTPILPVSVRFAPVPPKIFMVTSCSKTVVDETTVGQLDHAQFVNIDLEITPYRWQANGNTGIKAYLKTGYFVLVEDPFAAKYAAIGVNEPPVGLDETPF